MESVPPHIEVEIPVLIDKISMLVLLHDGAERNLDTLVREYIINGGSSVDRLRAIGLEEGSGLEHFIRSSMEAFLLSALNEMRCIMDRLLEIKHLHPESERLGYRLFNTLTSDMFDPNNNR